MIITNPNEFYKHCRKCGEWKLSDQFHNDKRRHDGRYPNCKDCHYSYMRSRYATQEGVRDRHLAHHKQQRQMNHEYRERHQKYAAKHYSSFDGRAKTLLKGAYKRDPGATVTLEHIVRMLGLGVCPVTKIPFDISSGFRRGGNGHNNPFAPSLDQIVAKGGYTNANTRLVIWQYNMMKGERTDEELLFICRSIVENAE